MKNLLLLLILALAAGSCKSPATNVEKTSLEIKDNWYYVNGEKFFIKGIGYEIGARPGQDPYKQHISDLERMKYDLQVIKDAGYNTIRTWSQLSEAQLKVVQESGLKVIFGIWIDPHHNFGDPEFVDKSIKLTDSIVTYSKNYDCIISYLILNEPMTEHIYESGAENTVNLLKKIKEVLNREHPGIPVSMSGSSVISDYINYDMFDFHAINSYDYGAYQMGSMGGANFLKWSHEVSNVNRPLVLTEFGFSVSDQGDGNYGYGGNTLEEQKKGLIRDYRALLDAGATGACPFYYADGWWKGKEDSIHNNVPEEWFGFFGYSDLNDTIGSARPVWGALKTYMKGLVLSPKNGDVLDGEIPVEVYVDKEVALIECRYHDRLIFSKKIEGHAYLNSRIDCEEILGSDTTLKIKDAELVFSFLNSKDKVLKSESIIVLVSKTKITLPELKISLSTDDLSKAGKLVMKISISNMGPFKFAGNLKYNFNSHIGWSTGATGAFDLSAINGMPSWNNGIELLQETDIPQDCMVMTPSAGILIKYGKFKTIIHDQTLLYRGNWADPIKVTNLQNH